MKMRIRRNVFETNSSNTHSITICTQEDYDKFKDGKLYYTWGELKTEEEIKEEFKRHKKSKWYEGESYEDWLESMIADNEMQTYDNYGSEYLEEFYKEFITPSGDKMVAFGEYGRDG